MKRFNAISIRYEANLSLWLRAPPFVGKMKEYIILNEALHDLSHAFEETPNPPPSTCLSLF